MQIVIDVDEDRLNSIKHFGIKQNEVYMLEKAYINKVEQRIEKHRAEEVKAFLEADRSVEE